MREKINHSNSFSFPLLRWFFEHTQCTAALCCCVPQHVRQPWQCYQLMKLLWLQHCQLYFVYYAVPFSGWRWCGYTACCICTAEKTPNQWLPGEASADFTAKAFVVSHFWKEICFYQMCSRTSEQQSSYSYLVYIFLIWKPNKVFIRVRSSINTRISQAHPQEQGNLLGQWIVTFLCMCYKPPVHKKQSQKNHNREASLRPWTD